MPLWRNPQTTDDIWGAGFLETAQIRLNRKIIGSTHFLRDERDVYAVCTREVGPAFALGTQTGQFLHFGRAILCDRVEGEQFTQPKLSLMLLRQQLCFANAAYDRRCRNREGAFALRGLGAIDRIDGAD